MRDKLIPDKFDFYRCVWASVALAFFALASFAPTSANAAKKTSRSHYASTSFRYTSHFDFGQLIDDGESMWRHIDIEPSWFRVIEYGYIHDEDVSFSLSLAIPDDIEDLARSVFLGIQAGGWFLSVEAGFLSGKTTNETEVFSLGTSVDVFPENDDAAIPIGQKIHNRYLNVSALKYQANSISWGGAYIQNRVPRSFKLMREVSGSTHREAPKRSFSPANTMHIVGLKMQMSPTKALSIGYDISTGSTEIYRGTHYRSFIAVDVDAIFGLAVWQRDTRNDEFIQEQVTSTPADYFLYEDGKIVATDITVDAALSGTIRLEWLNLWNYPWAQISAGAGIEARSHQYLPLSHSTSDASDHPEDIVLSLGYDMGNVMWGPYLRIAASW